MSRRYLACLAALACLLLAACGGPSQAAPAESGSPAAEEPPAVQDTAPVQEPASRADGIDVDLTELSATMAYSQIYDMMCEPDRYLGKSVRIRGTFSAYHDETTGSDYFACLIPDAAACCTQGLEFIWAGEHTYPDDYPALSSEITVTGVFGTYQENGIAYCRLTDAELAF